MEWLVQLCLMLAPHVQRRLYLALLSSKQDKIEFEYVSRVTGIDQDVARSWLLSLGISGIERDPLVLKERVWAALLEGAVSKGIPLEVIAGTIPWQRFEVLAKEALLRYGFEACRHVRFAYGGRRWEIDVLGVRDGDMICMDCKQWKKGGKGGVIRNSTREQLSRVVALSKLKTKPRLLRARRRRLNAYAALMTLLDTGRYIVDGCFIVPITKLNSFLDQFYELRGLVRPVRIEQEGPVESH